VPVQEIFVLPSLAALVGPVQNILFLTGHFFYSFETIAQQAGQAVVLGRLSLSMCPERHVSLLLLQDTSSPSFHQLKHKLSQIDDNWDSFTDGYSHRP